MNGFLNALRSALYVLWLAATVIPWAIFSLVASIFMRGTPFGAPGQFAECATKFVVASILKRLLARGG